jgi:ribose transport system ATP-binding protein
MHALLGPNGAGKSTVIKILSGLEHAGSGAIVVDGEPLASRRGAIGTIHQDLGLVDGLSVRENLLLMHPETLGAGIIALRRERRRAAEALGEVGLDLDPETPLRDLGLGQKSLVAVARLLMNETQILILDEITAALTHVESRFVLSRVRDLAHRGASVIVVTHRLREVTEFCDWVTFLQDGRVTHSGSTPSASDLHELFTRRREGSEAQVPPGPEGPVLADLRGAIGDRVGPVDLTLHAGEIVGLVGTLASNLYAIGHMLAGRAAIYGGERVVRGPEDPAGTVALVPEDRRAQGLLRSLEVSVNASVTALPKMSRLGWVQRGRERDAVASAIAALDVRPQDTSTKIESLSGGNQQKILIGRAAMSRPDVYVLCEPTRGVDLATRHAIYDFIRSVARGGAAVLIITIDPEDALAVSHRIGVVVNGSISLVRAARELDLANILEEL